MPCLYFGVGRLGSRWELGLSSLYFVSVNVSALLKSFPLENCTAQNNQLVEDIISDVSVYPVNVVDSVGQVISTLTFYEKQHSLPFLPLISLCS